MTHKLRTVLGDIDPSEMGQTLPHEHIQGVCDVYWYPGDDPLADPDPAAAPRVDNLWHWKENPVANKGNMHMTDEQVSIDEMRILPDLGVRTVVNLTPIGMYRNAEGLRRISQAANVNIVAGSTYYTAESHPSELKDMSEEQISQRIVDDITTGMDGTDIRAGIVGEVGLSWPLDPVEEKVLAASVDAHRKTGAGLAIHNPYYAHGIGGLEPLRVIAERISELGADMSRVIMGHTDGFARDPGFIELVRDHGFVAELDMFGYQSGYEPEADFMYPADGDRVEVILAMAQAGLADRLVLSHDVIFKTTLMRWGGHGFGYIHRVIVPWLKRKGLDDKVLEQILETNCQNILPMAV
ncbi:phosphotriesterase family protein [Gordonia mangrovi]|nr:hypothetical protein [Gordonia mangrovi]